MQADLWIRVAGFFLTLAGIGSGVLYIRRRRHRGHHHQQTLRFSRCLIDEWEAQRATTADEIRNGLEHELVLIKNTAVSLLQNPVCDEVLCGRLKLITQYTANALDQSRRISENLRPADLDRLGFRRTLDTLLSRISDRTSLRLFSELDNLEQLLPVSEQIQVYRLVEIGLDNIEHHTASDLILLEIKRQGNRIRLLMDAAGNRPANPAIQRNADASSITEAVWGRMRHRVELLNGDFEVQTLPAHGIRIQAMLPIPK